MTARVELAGPPLAEPHALDAAELAGAAAGGEHCPSCRGVPTAGVRGWEDRGPQRLLAVVAYRCAAGHAWEAATGGG